MYRRIAATRAPSDRGTVRCPAGDGYAGEYGQLQLLFSLPEIYRTTLYLSAVMGYTTGEIASLLHLLPGTARVRLSRARERMAQLLQETENTKGGSIL